MTLNDVSLHKIKDIGVIIGFIFIYVVFYQYVSTGSINNVLIQPDDVDKLMQDTLQDIATEIFAIRNLLKFLTSKGHTGIDNGLILDWIIGHCVNFSRGTDNASGKCSDRTSTNFMRRKIRIEKAVARSKPEIAFGWR